ncbi:hypothetical protein GCM10010912_33600 [Paenibacillus albidus]|uniref:Uncharacterized protein n=1 Tax=Paenibacillus albidus TaxID=2041023 RepID=A0A917FJ66_9BACL|nr:hypothetical protein [Paenibacillus albidus]GGF85568.1 hypothetical protein GCM10010912_33600 [Paenibacillus albidus]
MMRTIFKGIAVAVILTLPVLTGCAAQEQAPGLTQVNRMSTMDGGLDPAYGPPSPVMQDVYDRSIPAEVYSGE